MYMLELSLVEVQMNKWSPSLMACSTIYVANKILHRPAPWSSFMSAQTKHSEKEVHKCAKELCFIINVAHLKRHFQAVFKKYNTEDRFFVSDFCKSLSEKMED